jgi:membrane protease YdiL (CAAX protease family)
MEESTIWKFFGLIFFLTWLFWIPAGLLSIERHALLIRVLQYIGGLMVPLSALVMLYSQSDSPERKNYWRRLIDFRRIKPSWYLVIFLTVPFLTLIGAFSDLWLGGKGLELGALSGIIANPVSLIPFALFILIFGPIPEEMAWRGYALDLLQEKFKALSASLILGIAWALWHLPLFWIEGTYQAGLGVVTPQFWLYMLVIIPETVVMTWIYNHNRRSTVTAILFHFMINFTGELIDLSMRAEMITVFSWWMLASLVVLIYKPDRLVQDEA